MSAKDMADADKVKDEEELPDKEEIDGDDADTDVSPSPESGNDENASDGAADDAAGIDGAVTVLEEQLAEYKDKHLRLAAEFDNYKKRMSRQFDNVVKTANDGLIADTIEVFDNFERALDAAKDSDDFDSFHQGVEMIFKQLKDMLGKRGVAPMETDGVRFDPELHEAVMMVENEDKESDEIVDVVQKGYVCGDRVIRHAKVTVNK